MNRVVRECPSETSTQSDPENGKELVAKSSQGSLDKGGKYFDLFEDLKIWTWSIM